MSSPLPILVTNVPSRAVLARVARSALANDVERLPCDGMASESELHTLHVRVGISDVPSLVLLAELAGTAHGGRLPLRLRPQEGEDEAVRAIAEAEDTDTDPSTVAPAVPSSTRRSSGRMRASDPIIAPSGRFRVPPPTPPGRAPRVVRKDDPTRRTSPSMPWKGDALVADEKTKRVPTALVAAALREESTEPTPAAMVEQVVREENTEPTPAALVDQVVKKGADLSHFKDFDDDEETHVDRDPWVGREGEESYADPAIGRALAGGKYVIEARVGSGASGVVYRSRHVELRRVVAVKLLHPRYQRDAHFMKSFRGEALSASRLDHPNILRVLDFGVEPDGLVYIVMEYLSGRTLQSILDESQRLSTERAVEIMVQVTAALSVAHDHGIVHRDVKPDNIMLVPTRDDEGRTFELVKVCDFGIAALTAPRPSEDSALMDAAMFAGTPAYMAPEQARGDKLDARSDIYAVGVCLFELVSGRPPFLGTAGQVLVAHLRDDPPRPSTLVRGMDPLLEEIILRALEKDPARRQQSARELRGALKELVDHAEAEETDPRSRDVESALGLDDPASGFAGFFITFASAVLQIGSFGLRGSGASPLPKALLRAVRTVLRGRRELTFARRDATTRGEGYVVMTGQAEVSDLRRLLGSQIHGSHGEPFSELLDERGVVALTIRDDVTEADLTALLKELMEVHDEDALRTAFARHPPGRISALFETDLLGRERGLPWKIVLATSRLARDLRVLAAHRVTLKQLREGRRAVVRDASQLMAAGDEARLLLLHADLVDETVANVRGFSGFSTGPALAADLIYEVAAEAAVAFAAAGPAEHPELSARYLRQLVERLLHERTEVGDASLVTLRRMGALADDDVPREIATAARAEIFADILLERTDEVLAGLDRADNPQAFDAELTELEAAMPILARRGEPEALVAIVSALARHARSSRHREARVARATDVLASDAMLLPIANVLFHGPAEKIDAARKLLVFAGPAGAHALLLARDGITEPAHRAMFVRVFRETGPAGWALLANVLPRLSDEDDATLALAEDLLRCLPDRPSPELGEIALRFAPHPYLRPIVLGSLRVLLGPAARRPLVEAFGWEGDAARLVALAELRCLGAIDGEVVPVIERMLTMREASSEPLRILAALALGDATPDQRSRAITLLGRLVEGKRGILASLRGDAPTSDTLAVVEATCRALVHLDPVNGARIVRARAQRDGGGVEARLAAILDGR